MRKSALAWFAVLIWLLSGHPAPAATGTTGGQPFVPLANGSCTGTSCKGDPNAIGVPFYVVDGVAGGKLALDATIQSVLTTLQAPLTFNLPTGASTSALQATGNGYLLTIAGNSATQATAAKQDTGNTTLASMLAVIATATNQATANGYLSTLATASASQATAANQATQITAEQTTATQTTGINTKLASPLPLPTGASSAANQTNVQSAPGTPQTTAVTIQGNASGVAVPVSQASQPLPSNAAQETGGNLATVANAQGAQGTGSTFNPPAGGSGILGYLSGIYKAITGTLAISGSTTNAGYTLTGSPAPISVTTSSASVTGLTLPGKVRFQASPVTTLGQGTLSTVAVEINYSGGNACTQPSVILGAGQIDDWINITTSTAPTVCAASSTTLLAVQ